MWYVWWGKRRVKRTEAVMSTFFPLHIDCSTLYSLWRWFLRCRRLESLGCTVWVGPLQCLWTPLPPPPSPPTHLYTSCIHKLWLLYVCRTFSTGWKCLSENLYFHHSLFILVFIFISLSIFILISLSIFIFISLSIFILIFTFTFIPLVATPLCCWSDLIWSDPL